MTNYQLSIEKKVLWFLVSNHGSLVAKLNKNFRIRIATLKEIIILQCKF